MAISRVLNWTIWSLERIQIVLLVWIWEYWWLLFILLFCYISHWIRIRILVLNTIWLSWSTKAHIIYLNIAFFESNLTLTGIHFIYRYILIYVEIWTISTIELWSLKLFILDSHLSIFIISLIRLLNNFCRNPSLCLHTI